MLDDVKMILKTAINNRCILLGIIIIIYMIPLIVNMDEHLIGIVCYAAIGIGILFHNRMKDKQKIDWTKYKTINNVAMWWGACGLMFPYTLILNHLQLSNRPVFWEIEIGMCAIGILALWSYFAMMLASKNALFVLRSLYIILIIFYLELFFPKDNFVIDSHEQMIVTVFMLLIFALLIKGLISTFSPNYKKAFPKTEVSYLTVLAVVILGFMSLAAPNIEFNLTLPFTNTETNIPLLHHSK